MEYGIITILGAAIQLGFGILLMMVGLMISENLDSFLMLFNHRELPDYVKEKDEVNNVLNYVKAIGIIMLVLGVGLMVFALIRLGLHIFW